MVIKRGIMWKYELKATEIFRSRFRLMQCFNCQRYGHIARNCTATAKCGNCAENHNTRECTGKKEIRCCNCCRKHRAWDLSCPLRIAAKTKATNHRTHDLGRYQDQDQPSMQKNEWQIAGSSKSKPKPITVNITSTGAQIAGTRKPGRPRKTPI